MYMYGWNLYGFIALINLQSFVCGTSVRLKQKVKTIMIQIGN